MGKFEDWVRSETRKRLTKLNAANAGFNTQNQLNDVEFITFTNGEKTKGKTASGIVVNTIPKGGVGVSGIGYRTNGNTYVVAAGYRKIKSIDNKVINGYKIVNKVVGDERKYYIWKLGTGEDVLYYIDTKEIGNYSSFPIPPDLTSFIGIDFTENGDHIYVSYSSADIGEAQETFRYGFALNWSLTTNELGEKVVTWTSIIHETVNFDFSSLLVDGQPPGLPANYTADGTNAALFPNTEFTYIYWEEESDPLIPFEPFIQWIGSLIPVIYTDQNNIPKVDFIGNLSLNQTYYTNFRVAAMYNASAIDVDGNPIPVSEDYPDGVCPITYGQILLDEETGQYYREIFIPAFGWNTQSTTTSIGSGAPYDYNGLLVGGDVEMDLPVGNYANGIGNVYHHNIFPLSLDDSISAMGNGNFFDGYGVSLYNVPDDTSWWTDSDQLTPETSGIFTQFFSTNPEDSAVGWLMPDWINDPIPAGSDIWGIDPDQGPQQRLYGYGASPSPSVMPASFVWSNSYQKNVLISKKYGESLTMNEVKIVSFERSTTQVVDPTYGGYVQIYLNEEDREGDRWVFGGGFNSSVYKRVDSQGNEHIVTIKSNMDAQTFYFGFPIGPSQFILNNDYLNLSSLQQIDVGHFAGVITDSICFVDDYIIV